MTETTTNTADRPAAGVPQRVQTAYERKIRLGYKLLRLFGDPACPLGLVQGLHDLMQRLVGGRAGGDD